MKKVVVGIFLLLILFIAFAYLFVPGQVEIKTSSVIKVSPQAATRILTKTNEWEKWWPPSEIGVSTRSTLKYNKSSYKIHQHLSNGFDITILDTPDSVHSLLTLLPLHIDSLEVQWNGISNTGINPF